MKSFPKPRPNIISRRFIKDSRLTIKRIQKFIDDEEKRQEDSAPYEPIEPDVIIEKAPTQQ